MKAADIPDDTLLSAVRALNGGEGRWATIWGLEERLPGFPRKVVLAKCRGLIRRGLLHGCPCGCRGDFEVPRGC